MELMNLNVLRLLLEPKYTKYILRQYIQNRRFKKKGKKNVFVDIHCNVKNSDLSDNTSIFSDSTFNNSKLGENSYISNNCKILNTKIGNFCSIAPHVTIGIGIHPIDFISTHPAFYSNNKRFKTYADRLYIDEYKETIIGNDVWIGLNAVIPGGVVIGDGAIIASGAVVTGDVESYSIVGGIPAKHIKYRFDIKTRQSLMKIKWWDFNYKWIENNYKLFHKPCEFINVVKSMKVKKNVE